MKKIMLSVLLLAVSVANGYGGQKGGVEVDYSEETELVSLVAHLAGVPGYAWDEQVLRSYCDEVDSVFARYKEHEAVRFVADSLVADGFNWHFPVTLAMHTQFSGAQLRLRDDIVACHDGYYERITPERELKLVALLNKFNSDAGFHDFYAAHMPFYEECKKAMLKVAGLIDFGWYDKFFGPRAGSSFKICLGVLIGPANYSVHIKKKDGSETVNAMMGCCGRDGAGNIYYGVEYTLPIILHECNHSYCNQLNREFWDGIKHKAAQVFSRNAAFYASIAYGDAQLVMNETFVEACVIRYLMTHKVDMKDITVDDWIKMDEVDKKFTLIRPLVKLLEERESNPDLYPTMRDFMPRYVEAVNGFMTD